MVDSYFQVQADPSARLSERAHIVGDVKIGADSCVLAGACLRGDVAPIVIGRRTNIQEGVIIHEDHEQPCCVGDEVVVGHGAILHGCTIGNRCLIGMGAIVMNKTCLGEGCIVAAGAVVPQGKIFPARTLIMGCPGKACRDVTDEEYESQIVAGAAEYVEISARMVEEGVLFRPTADYRGQA